MLRVGDLRKFAHHDTFTFPWILHLSFDSPPLAAGVLSMTTSHGAPSNCNPWTENNNWYWGIVSIQAIL